ncbi:MAG TPA: antitoxin [Thermoanaerobaculia bacterium]|nr:antitoxin [Thermoanaerobaculia bacterium]
MSKRLQVLFEEEELAEIQRVARRHRMTVAQWVREALRTIRRQEPGGDRERKLAAIREAARHRFPAGSIEDMLAEIERGYLGDRPK